MGLGGWGAAGDIVANINYTGRTTRIIMTYLPGITTVLCVCVSVRGGGVAPCIHLL